MLALFPSRADGGVGACSMILMASILLSPTAISAFARTGARSAAGATTAASSYLLTSAGARAGASTAKSGLYHRRRLPFLRAGAQDTPETLPDFANKEEYLKFMEPLSGLPSGFATGTANGKFVSVEAPALGPLPIRGTVIHLTDGPTDNWAATFTKNKVKGLIQHRGLKAALSLLLL